MIGEIATAAKLAAEVSAETAKEVGAEVANKAVDIGKRVDISKSVKPDINPEKVDISKRLSPEKVREVGVEDSVTKSIGEKLQSVDSIKEVLKSFNDGGRRIEVLEKNLDVINNSESTPMEINAALGRVNQIKGDVLEQATKKSLAEAGFDIKEKVDMVAGESGNTLPDVIATNNTGKVINALGRTINPGEMISAECKCGGSPYLHQQLEKHIPNQLSGLPGQRALVTTSDIGGVSNELVDQVCEKYNAKLNSVDISAKDVLNNLKGVVV